MTDRDKIRRTPAAYSAAFAGDYVNASIASTPGGIEAQEKRGQAAIQHNDRLPIKDLPRTELEALGFVFGEPLDDLFIACTFPDGWQMRPSDHSMWSYLHDAQGRKRASIFYKAAFYDRGAFMSLTRRYSSSSYATDAETGNTRGGVLDNATDTLIYRPMIAPIEGEQNWEYSNRVGDAAKAWLDTNYPEWGSDSAYWD